VADSACVPFCDLVHIVFQEAVIKIANSSPASPPFQNLSPHEQLIDAPVTDKDYDC
jgi:hypothetical protein